MAEITYETISMAFAECENLQRAWLRQNGWEWSCDFPGGIWLWCKRLPDGRSVGVGVEQAIEIQRHLGDEVNRTTQIFKREDLDTFRALEDLEG